MKKLDITAYKVLMPDGKEELVETKRSILNIMFSYQQELSIEKLLEAGGIRDKIIAANGELLLEDAEFKFIMDAVGKIKGLSLMELELVRRLKNAPDVAVIETPA